MNHSVEVDLSLHEECREGVLFHTRGTLTKPRQQISDEKNMTLMAPKPSEEWGGI